jgi:hypothetical protein
MTGDWRGWVSSEVSARGGVFPKLGNDADGLHNSTATGKVALPDRGLCSSS